MRTMLTLSLAAFVGTLALSPLHADEWDKKTIITIETPVQLPSTTLQPGTYTLKLLDSASDRHIVTVWDKDGKHLDPATVLVCDPELQADAHGPLEVHVLRDGDGPAGRVAGVVLSWR